MKLRAEAKQLLWVWGAAEAEGIHEGYRNNSRPHTPLDPHRRGRVGCAFLASPEGLRPGTGMGGSCPESAAWRLPVCARAIRRALLIRTCGLKALVWTCHTNETVERVRVIN